MSLRLPVEISWCPDDSITSALDSNGNILYPYVRIYRSMHESSGYDLISTDVEISTNQHPVEFVQDELCRDISFNKDFDIDAYLQGLTYTDGKSVLLTLGSQEPEKVELFAIKDENNNYRLCLDDKVIYNNVQYGLIKSGWHGKNFNVGNLVLNMTELPITYVSSELTRDFISNSVNYDSKNPYVKHQVISEINSQINGYWINKWTDPTIDIRQKDCYYYIIKYLNADKTYESKFFLPRKSLSPKEQRLVNYLKVWLSNWITNCATDDEIRAGIVFALETLNIKSPVTHFTIESLPQILESTLMVGSAIYTMMVHYLGIGFSDVSYTDSGVSITIDRGGKIQNAIDKATAYYDKIIDVAKLHYLNEGCAIGSIPLQISLGGKMSGNILGAISNIFNAIGR